MKSIDNRDDPGSYRDLPPLESIGVAGTVEALMVMFYNRENVPGEGYIFEQFACHCRMVIHDAFLSPFQSPFLPEEIFLDTYLANIVQGSSHLGRIDYILGYFELDGCVAAIVDNGIDVSFLEGILQIDKRLKNVGQPDETVFQFFFLNMIFPVVGFQTLLLEKGFKEGAGYDEIRDAEGPHLRVGSDTGEVGDKEYGVCRDSLLDAGVKLLYALAAKEVA